MVQPNTHGRNPIAINPKNYFFPYKKKRKEHTFWRQKLKREDYVLAGQQQY